MQQQHESTGCNVDPARHGRSGRLCRETSSIRKRGSVFRSALIVPVAILLYAIIAVVVFGWILVVTGVQSSDIFPGNMSDMPSLR